MGTPTHHLELWKEIQKIKTGEKRYGIQKYVRREMEDRNILKFEMIEDCKTWGPWGCLLFEQSNWMQKNGTATNEVITDQAKVHGQQKKLTNFVHN